MGAVKFPASACLYLQEEGFYTSKAIRLYSFFHRCKINFSGFYGEIRMKNTTNAVTHSSLGNGIFKIRLSMLLPLSIENLNIVLVQTF